MKSLFVCQSCGNEYSKWMGKCSACGQWNSLVETVVGSKAQKSRLKSQRRKGKIEIINLAARQLPLAREERLTTGISEFDRVLGGGLVAGQVVLLAGEPGIGKSTLILQVAQAVTTTSARGPLAEPRVVYLSGEESPSQIKLRAERLGLRGENISLVSATDVDALVDLIENWELKIKNSSRPLVVVDSIQTLTTDDLSASGGSIAQVKECTARIINAVKPQGFSTILIGHVNKEGEIAGPKVLEHMVDTVLYLEGERFQSLRLLRAIKNRFGDVGEVGVFEMSERGFVEVRNPSSHFLQTSVFDSPGSVVTVTLSGTRPVLLEVQALTSKSSFNYPRRSSTGFDLNRLFFIGAVLEKHLKIPLPSFDVYVNVTGGVKIEEPAADLAVALAIVSSFRGKSVRPKTLIFGEVGLSGEVRPVSAQAKRLKEGRHLGFKNIVSPEEVKTVAQAVEVAL